jgi:hypothetical protein
MQLAVARSIQRLASGQTAVVRFSVGARGFSLFRNAQNGSETHPGSYTIGTEGCMPG